MLYRANQSQGQRPSPLLKRAASICMTIGAVACSSGQAPLSEVKHNEGEPVRSSRGSQYVALDRDGYVEYMADLVGVSPRDILPADHPLSVRLQYWLDQLDQSMRKDHPDQLANVPKPLIQVVRDSVANAFVAPAPVCFDVPVAFGEEGSQGTTLDRAYLDLGTGEMSDFPEDFKCVESTNGPKASLKELKEILADTKGKFGDCHFDFTAAGKVRPSKDCKLDSSLRDVAGAERLVVMKTASFVTVFTGIIPLMTEEAIVGALAHELGHYYRSHPTAQESDFGYFYKLQKKQPAFRPEADPALNDLGQKAVESSTVLSFSEMMTKLDGQKLRSELYFAAGSVVKNLCRWGQPCPTSCRETYELMQSSDFDDAVGYFPFSDDQKVDASMYAKFEASALACFANVKLSSNPKALDPDSVGWESVSSLIQAPSWPTWLGGLSSKLRRAVSKLNTVNAERLAKIPPKVTTLDSAFLAASRALDDIDHVAVKTLERAQKEGLGQYTIEQESDEFSAEWVAKAGVNPHGTVEAMRSLGKGSDTSLSGFILGEEDCESLWKNNWSKGESDYFFVPIGDYSEIHHSTCYRMFNLEREIEAHRYSVAKTDAKLLPEGEWAALKKMAVNLSTPDEGLVLFIPSAFQERFLSSYLRSCTYSSRFH